MVSLTFPQLGDPWPNNWLPQIFQIFLKHYRQQIGGISIYFPKCNFYFLQLLINMILNDIFHFCLHNLTKVFLTWLLLTGAH